MLGLGPLDVAPVFDGARLRDGLAGQFLSFAGRHLALIDDVMTTGATLEAAAAALLQAGADRVDAWVVARTLPPGSV